MEFQRYYDGVGLIVQNKIDSALYSCPLCNEKAQWEIVFDFKGDIICVLAKCPVCGGVVKTIFDFANNQPISSFTVSAVGEQNKNSLNQGEAYSLPSASVAYSSSAKSNGYSSGASGVRQNKSNGDSDSAGWGILGFFIPIVGFILWLVWKDEKPRCSRAAGIGCLVSICLSVVSGIIYGLIIVGVIFGSSALASALPALAAML